MNISTEVNVTTQRSKYKVCIFDFDGTIANTQHAISHCIKKTMNLLQTTPPSDDTVISTIGLSLQDVFSHLGVSHEFINQYITVYRDIYAQEALSHTQLYPGIAELFKRCHQRGLKVVIASNKGSQAVEIALSHFHLTHLVDAVMADDGVLPKKPDPAMINDYVLTQYPIKRSECLVIGDTSVDIKFSRNALVDCCWVSYGFGDNAKCVALGPTYIAGSVEEIKACVFC